MSPYLIGPLVDDVLVPYQNQVEAIRQASLDPEVQAAQLEQLKEADKTRFWTLVSWYLAGIGGAAVLTWLLTWGQGIVMAWASERISADLRNHTYAHLQRLSLEFFGGKRTGDLLSRISTDTERICYFLSDNMVDFATDVLMIIGTAGIMLWINPAMALAALLPFPLIAWLVYKARDHMQRGFQRGGRAWGEMTSILADTIPGIRVVKVCPGIVDTKFREHVLAGKAPEPVGRITRVVSAEQVAQAIVLGIESGARTVYIPAIARAFVALEALSSTIMDWYVRRQW